MKKHIAAFLFEKDNPFVQFLKYGICGGVATVTDMAVFFLLAWLVFPALTESDPFTKLLSILHFEIREVTEPIRLQNYWVGKVMSFLVSNIVAYTLNVLFVFKAGKHKRHHEMILFIGLSLIAFLIGTFAGGLMIRFAGLDTTYSYVAAMVSAVLINYAGRKFFIFHG